MMKQNNKTIGILGGMGAEASCRLHELLIKKARTDFGAKINSEFPELMILSLPSSDRLMSRGGSNETEEMIRAGIKRLKKTGIDLLGIACNTAHAALDMKKMEADKEIEFVSMIEVCGEKAERMKVEKVGLLATPRTVETGLFQTVFKKKKIELLIPGKHNLGQLEKIIKLIIKGEKQLARKGLLRIADKLVNRGAEAVLLGCTELPLVFPKRFKVKTINSLEELAKALINRYYKGEV